MPLTDTAVKAAKPADKPRKIFDGDGLYLEVAPSGGKWWRLKQHLARWAKPGFGDAAPVCLWQEMLRRQGTDSVFTGRTPRRQAGIC